MDFTKVGASRIGDADYANGIDSGKTTSAKTTLTGDIPDAAKTKETQNSIPSLQAGTVPATHSNLTTSLGATASVGAMIMALIEETMSEQVRANREMTYASQMQSADLMEEQSDKMKQQATVKLICSVVSSTVSLAAGAAQAGVSLSSTGNAALSEADKILKSGFAQSLNQAIGSVGSAIQAGGEFNSTMVDAQIKQLEADQKRIDAFTDQVKSITESLNSVVRKAIDTSSSLSQNMIEANKRILG